MGHEIECPLHQGPLRRARRPRALFAVEENLATYPVRIEDGFVFVALGSVLSVGTSA